MLTPSRFLSAADSMGWLDPTSTKCVPSANPTPVHSAAAVGFAGAVASDSNKSPSTWLELGMQSGELGRAESPSPVVACAHTKSPALAGELAG